MASKSVRLRYETGPGLVLYIGAAKLVPSAVRAMPVEEWAYHVPWTYLGAEGEMGRW